MSYSRIIEHMVDRGYKGPTNYGFRYYTDDDADGFRPLNVTEKRAMKEAMDLWSDVANVKFNWWTGSDVIHLGVKELDAGGLHKDPLIGDWAIWIDPDQTVPVSTSVYGAYYVGSNGFATYIHEVGHAVGLDHPGDYNGVARRTERLYDLDTRAHTVMSYFDEDFGGVTTFDFKGQRPQTPMWLDIDAVQKIYGANLTTRIGDNVYGYNAGGEGMRGVFDFTKNWKPVVTIYDRGGVDTLDLSGSSTANVVRLNPGEVSDVLGLRGNLRIDDSTWIENVIGGSGRDEVFGNRVANHFTDSPGSDEYDGSWGYDTLDFSLQNLPLHLSVHDGWGTALRRHSYLDGSTDRFDDIERIIGSKGSDHFYVGDDVAVHGGSGQDKFWSHGERVSLQGEGGADTFLLYGDGFGSVHGGSSQDTVSYELAGGAVSASLRHLHGTTTEGASHNLYLIENLTGSDHADVLIGSNVNNILDGGLGDDRLEGRGGDNTLIGGAGIDTIVYTDVFVFDIASVSGGWEITTSRGMDTVSEVENIQRGNGAAQSILSAYFDQVEERAVGAGDLVGDGWFGDYDFWMA